jgi:hypothetical protein
VQHSVRCTSCLRNTFLNTLLHHFKNHWWGSSSDTRMIMVKLSLIQLMWILTYRETLLFIRFIWVLQQAFEGHTASSVSIATRLWEGQWRRSSLSLVRIRRFFISRLALESTQPSIQWEPWAIFPGVKRQGCEADHSPPSSAEVRNGESYTSTSPYDYMVWCLNNLAQGWLTLSGSCMILHEQRSHTCCSEPFAAEIKAKQDKQ